MVQHSDMALHSAGAPMPNCCNQVCVACDAVSFNYGLNLMPADIPNSVQEHYCIAIGINDAAGLLGTFDFDTFSAPGVPGAHFRRAHSMQRAS